MLGAQSSNVDAWDFLRAFGSGVLIAWPVLVVLVLLFVGSVALGLYRRIRLARSGMGDIDRMGGGTFERYLEVMFSRLGYKVVRTRFTGDFGGDLVLSKGGRRTVVQAKRWTRRVGVRAVQEVVAAKGQYDCAEAMVVTNSFYTKQALHLARKNHVVLWDRTQLASRLLQTHANDNTPATAKFIEDHPAAIRRSVASQSLTAAVSDSALPNVETCATCSKVLTPGERAYCDDHRQRFAGQMLCFRHQRMIKRS